MSTMVLTTFWEVLAWITIAFFWLIALAIFIWAFTDTFKRRDLSGMGKALWILAIFVLPLLGPLLYLVFRPNSASYEREGLMEWAPQPGTRLAPAEELAYAKQLLDQGTITQQEFEDIKLRTIP
jgi:hypothetical protein